MNRFAAFEFMNDKGINELCDKYPLAAGTNVFVSEGKVLIQYQDGQDEPAAVQVLHLKEQIRTFEANKAEIVHSNKVNALQAADAEAAAAVAQAEMDKIQGQIDGSKRGSTKLKEDLKDVQEKYEAARARLRDVKSQTLLNNAEIARLDTNIELFREEIDRLSA